MKKEALVFSLLLGIGLFLYFVSSSSRKPHKKIYEARWFKTPDGKISYNIPKHIKEDPDIEVVYLE